MNTESRKAGNTRITRGVETMINVKANFKYIRIDPSFSYGFTIHQCPELIGIEYATVYGKQRIPVIVQPIKYTEKL